ncbi:MAG: hypothetical protein ACI9TY_001704 [Alphaproteobacteria bacterium]|jgi:hypothetical protein
MSQPIYIPERLVVYVVASDEGLAPNIQGNHCSLAVCKPVVRRVAKLKTDWIVGMSTNKHGKKKLIYVMQVEEKLSFNQFFLDNRFDSKKPHKTNPKGDNFIWDGQALRCASHYGHAEKMTRNLSVDNVLVARQYWYFGENAPEIPHGLFETKLVQGPRRGHKIVANAFAIDAFYNWLINQYQPGIHGTYRD